MRFALPCYSFAAVLFSALTITPGVHAQAAAQSPSSDFLVHEKIAIPNANSAAVLDRTADNLAGVFELFKIAVDSSSSVEKPLTVSGSARSPIIEASVKKCVAFICQTVDLDAVVSLTKISGSCTRNYVLSLDLAKSSSLLTQSYDKLNVAICYAETADGKGSLALDASAHHASSYEAGFIQNQIFTLLKLQIYPLTKALNQSLQTSAAGL